MNAFAEILRENPDLFEKVGFYTFFLGILLIVGILAPLLLEKERWLIPSIIVSFLLVGVMGIALEREGPLWSRKDGKIHVVYLTKTVEVPGAPARDEELAREVARLKNLQNQARRQNQQGLLQPGARPDPAARSNQPRPTTTITTIQTPVPASSPRPTPQPVAQPTPQPAARPVAQPASQPVAQPAARPATQPAPQPVSQPPTPPARTPPPASPPPSAPSAPSDSPTGGRTEEGLVLPTGNLVIQITSTLLLTVPGEATRSVMSISVDGRGVGGRKASSMRIQNDEAGNVLNVTYFWKGASVRMNNITTGNHRITVSLSVSGAGFKKSKTAWSGTVYVGEGDTVTVVLQGGFGDTLSRSQ